jgi:hypothetical protein
MRLIVVAALLISVSCNKSERDSDVNTFAPRDNAIAQALFNDLFLQVHNYTVSDSNLYSFASMNMYDTLCLDTVSVSSTLGTMPYIVTLDYGVAGVVCADGIKRRGKIKAEYNARYEKTNARITITPQLYYVNDIKITGKLELINLNRNNDGNIVFAENISDGLLKNDTINISYSAVRKREWKSGESTFNIQDDLFLITGTEKGTISKGGAYDSQITESLNHLACIYIGSGVVKITPAGLSPRITNYGNGGCDANAAVTINGGTFNISFGL